MSAIFGIYQRDGGPAARRSLAQQQAALAHRGPDGAGLWSGGPAGLGQLLLRTTPEARYEAQPLVCARRRLALVTDARLDNRVELIASLGLAGRPAAELADSALILAAYEHWGEDCSRHLLGDFAFAIWDAAAQRLLCARDHFGARPLYYFLADRLFAFATEPKGLLCLPGVPRRLNEVRVADFLGTLFDDAASTFFEGIAALEPAHSLVVGRDACARRRYWALDQGHELRLGSDEAYAEGFRHHFRAAVVCRLRSASPVGAMLSGGLDSSAIVCQARALLAEGGGARLHTYSAVFPGLAQSDERQYIAAVVAQGGLAHHQIDGRLLQPMGEIERVLWHGDEPTGAFHLAIDRAAYRLAAGDGVRVVLDGFDGDTTVSHGTGHLHTLARTGRVGALWGELRGLSRNYGSNPFGSLVAYLWGYHVARPMLGTPGLRAIYGLSAAAGARVRRALRRGEASGPPQLLRADFARRVGFAERRRALQQGRARAPRDEREEHYRRLTWGGLACTVELLNKAAAYGVEVRFPFWDRRLVEYCLALPPEQKLRRGWTRLVMRHALDGLLPPAVQWRGGKADLSAVLTTGLQAFERERIAATTFARSFEELGGDFYFGLGTTAEALAPAAGDILRVRRAAYEAPSPAPPPPTRARVALPIIARPAEQ